jgi:hypothetical protein
MARCQVRSFFFLRNLQVVMVTPTTLDYFFLIMCQLGPILSKENPLQVPFATPFFFTPNCENLQQKKTLTTSS